MDMISYGAASKAMSHIKKIKNQLGENVQGSFSNVKHRIDNIEWNFKKVTEKTDRLIIKDAINIMKAHAKLNAIAQSKKYKMHNMIFDDLLDLSGIDLNQSKNFEHDAITGMITANENCVIETIVEITEFVPEKIILTFDAKLGYTDNLIPEMTSDTAPSGRASISSRSSGSGGGYAYYAFDNKKNAVNKARFNGVKGWLQYEFPEPQNVRKYAVTGHDNNQWISQSPKDWTFEASNDGINWVILDTVVNQTDWKGAETKEFVIDNNQYYIYYRINVTANNSASFDTTISELEMFGLHEIKAYVSRDQGETWEEIVPNELYYFDNSVSSSDTKLKLKLELSKGTQLYDYAFTWA